MGNYLWNHFKGQYVVLPEIDKQTGDVPRNETGNIDPSYDDWYIPCRNDGIIRHSYRQRLSYFNSSIIKFNNVLQNIYSYELRTTFKTSDRNHLLQKMIEKQIIYEGAQLDGEGYFVFSSAKMIEWETFLKPKKRGSKRSPMSLRNFENHKITLSKEAQDEYQTLLDTYKSINSDKKTWAQFLTLVRVFTQNYCKINFGDKYYKDMREKGTSQYKVYIYAKGQWQDYIEKLKEYLNVCQK